MATLLRPATPRPRPLLGFPLTIFHRPARPNPFPPTPLNPLTTPPDLIPTLLAAYRDGWFPMGDPSTGRIEWVQPRRRAVIPLDPPPRFSRSLRARARLAPFLVTTDVAFEAVIRACAAPSLFPGRDATWIDPAILDAFLHLHRAGHAHSMEIWLNPSTSPPAPPVLVGGLYGLAIGRAFMGESMFCLPHLGGTDASKVALLHLVHHLRRRGFTLLDSQIQNPHMKSLGAVEITRARYLKLLSNAAGQPRDWLPFDPAATLADLATPAHP